MHSSLARLQTTNQGMVLLGQTINGFFVRQEFISQFVRCPPLTFFVFRGEVNGDVRA